MGGKAILILLLVTLGLSAVLMLTSEKVPINNVDESAVLMGRSLTNAKKIRWQFRDTQAVEVGHSTDGRFEIKEPIRDIASMGYMTQMVNAWDSANMRKTKYPDSDEGLQKTGLANPTMSFIVEWPDDQRLEIQVGDEGPDGSTRFLMVGGAIWEGGNGLIESMRVGLDDLREHRVFRHERANVRSLLLDQVDAQGNREPVRLEFVSGEWLLTEPVSGRADPVAAARFVTAVTSLRVDYFQPGVMDAPDRDPEIKISIEGGYGKESVDLWLEQGQIFGLLPSRGYIFTSSNQQYGQVFVNAVNNLRARILVPMKGSTFEDLVELVIDPGQGRGDRIRLVRTSPSTDWQMLEPLPYKMSPTPINESAHALHQLVAKAFAKGDGIRPRSKDPRYGMDGARWSVTTRRWEDQETHTLWFGADVPMPPGSQEPTMVYCCRSDEPDNVAIVAKQPLEVLQRSWLVYCDKQIVRQPAIVERILLEHSNGQKRTFAMDSDGAWSLEGTAGDRSEVGDFAQDILRDFVGKKAVDMRTGYDAINRWTLRMKRSNGDVLGLVQVWDRGEDLPLVAKGRSEQDVGFELNKSNSAALRAFWR